MAISTTTDRHGQNTLTFSDAAFDTEVLRSEVPVLVDFWAEWCGPCKAIAPALEELASTLQGKVTVAKLNIDENQATPKKYGVRGIPTLMLFKSGQVAAVKILVSGGYDSSFYLLGWTPGSFDSWNVLANMYRCRDDKGAGGNNNVGNYCNPKMEDLVKKVAYDTLSKKERKSRHLAAAAYLRELGDDDEVVEVVASHYLDAYRAAGG